MLGTDEGRSNLPEHESTQVVPHDYSALQHGKYSSSDQYHVHANGNGVESHHSRSGHHEQYSYSEAAEEQHRHSQQTHPRSAAAP
eukprot:GSA120T00019013001.1